MVFNSFAFLIFFPVVLLLYRVLPKKVRWVMLLASSYYFYMSWQPDLIYLILFTTVVSYVCSLAIEKTTKKGLKKLFLVIALVASLSVLFFFKYFNFLSTNVTAFLRLVRLPVSDFTLNLILPVGISFYTFQTLSYVIDVYRGTMKAERHFGYYALYVSYFPQLVAGPIERPENLIPQLRADNRFSAHDTVEGLKIMAVGFFKKIVVADMISKYVDAVYNGVSTADSTMLNGFTVLIATALFAVQIYCDFSGYTDIAIGCARVMGIKLMRNFNDPYSAVNIQGFWRRWHISLTSWFTDYIYIPLGGSKKGRAKHYANIFFVFLISGIWHGAAWTYILWGVMHGFYQIVGNLTEKPRSALRERMGITDAKWYAMFRRVVTFTLVLIAWVAFRANSLGDMTVLYKTLFLGWSGFSLTFSLTALGLGLVPAATIIMSLISIRELDKQIALKDPANGVFKGVAPDRAGMYIYLAWTIAAAWLILLSNSGASSFIYFQF